MSARLSRVHAGASTALLVLCLHLGIARGDPAPTPDVAGAPPPGQESGQTWNEESEPQTSTGRALARGILFIPKTLVSIVLLPVRGVVYLYDRYDLDDRYYATFYNASRTFGIHPTIEYATGFSLMAGGRLIATNAFGDQERFTMAGLYGGTFQSRAEVRLDSGLRLDPVKLTVGGNFDRFARLAFYGIGNNDDTLEQPLPMLIDPLVSDVAVQSFYRYEELRASADVDWRLLDNLHVIAHGAATKLSFEASTRDPAIDTVYNPMDLVGFTDGVKHLYGQLELRADHRRVAEPTWETTQYTTGWLASGFIGGVKGFDGAADFAHYGVDLQAFLHFAVGPRMLWLRFWAEGVTGSRDEVPFVELPYLGGDILRGYDYARFRDRISGVATAQYMWDVGRNVDAYLFVDAGRVYQNVAAITLDNMRLGFGGGFQIHTASHFLVATSLASSRDGGLFLTATLSPYWNEVPRWR